MEVPPAEMYDDVNERLRVGWSHVELVARFFPWHDVGKAGRDVGNVEGLCVWPDDVVGFEFSSADQHKHASR